MPSDPRPFAPAFAPPCPGTCLMTAVRDEGPDLLEWIAYHRAIGFERILVWSNDCSDGSDLMLDRLAAMGWIAHMRHSPPEGLSAQDNVARLALDHPDRRAADWVMWLDADEFLVIPAGLGHLTDLIGAIGKADGIAANWRVFGSMGLRQSVPGALASETFHQASALEDTYARVVKTLYRNRADLLALGIHRPVWPKDAKVRLLQGDGKPANDRFLHSPKKNGRPRDMVGKGRQSWALAQVNHYAIKALDRLALKRARGNGLEPGSTPDRFGADYLGWFDRNECEDRKIARHLPALRALMAELLADPALAEAYRATAAEQGARLGRVGAWVDHLLASALARPAATAEEEA